MIYGELSILPITVEINTRVISFWSKLYVIGLNENKLSSSIYSIIYSVDEKTNQHIQPQWVENVKQLLCSHGFSGIWYSQSYINPRWLTNAFKQKLKDVYIQNWQANLNIPSSSNNYRFFQESFESTQFCWYIFCTYAHDLYIFLYIDFHRHSAICL